MSLKKHKELVEKAKRAIEAVASDKDVDFATNLESLEELDADISGAMDGIKDDMKNDEEG